MPVVLFGLDQQAKQTGGMNKMASLAADQIAQFRQAYLCAAVYDEHEYYGKHMRFRRTFYVRLRQATVSVTPAVSNLSVQSYS